MTCQSPERIEYEKQMLDCYSEPLRSRLPATTGINIGDNDSPYPFQVSGSDNWRGYVGTWKIESGRLYLIELEGTCTDSGAAWLTTLFPDSMEQVFANWFTGSLQIQRGEVIGSIDSYYLKVYEEEVVLRVVSGVVTRTEIQRNQVPTETIESDQEDEY